MTKAKLSWMKFNDACALIEDNFPDGLDPAQVLGDAIKNGILSVRGLLETFNGKMHNIADGLDFARLSNTTLSQERFCHSRSKDNPALAHIDIDATFFPYEFDFFAAQSLSNQNIIEIYSDIEINERDLSSFLNRHFYWSSTGQDGRRREDHKWLAITYSLIRLERDGKLNNIDFPESRNLRTAILAMIDDVLDERTIRSGIDAIYAECVSGFDGKNWSEIRGNDATFDPLSAIRAGLTDDNSDTGKPNPG